MPTSTGQGNLEQATITNLDEGAVVTCMFRPKEYTFTKSNTWNNGDDKSNRSIGKGFTVPIFTGGDPMTTSLELWFDAYEKPPGQQDVRTMTNDLWKMMKPTQKHKNNKTGKSEPPYVEFRWGLSWTFRAVITQITEKFTLFLADGTPVRSMVTIALKQASEEGRYPGQNPTSRGDEGYAVHTVKEGESIDLIAYHEYGESTAWRHLAEANSLDDPSRLFPGQRLLLVPIG